MNLLFGLGDIVAQETIIYMPIINVETGVNNTISLVENDNTIVLERSN
jgi:hypothetical protein